LRHSKANGAPLPPNVSDSDLLFYDRAVSTDALTCRQLVELVTEYFEGALSPSERSRFEEHVMSCPPCRAHLEQMRQTMRVLGSIPETAVSPEAEKHLRTAFRGWRRE
jgi:anti-sigma factor RsiW